MTNGRDGLLALHSEDPEERRRATSELTSSALTGEGTEGIAELVTVAMSDEDWRVRKEAIVVALSLAPDSAMLEKLVGSFESSRNVGLRNAAVEALGGYGEAAVRAVSAALPKMDADARKLSAEALGRGGQPAALPVLEKLARDTDANVRLAAVEAIAGLGSFGVLEAPRLLKTYLESGEPLVVLAALLGLNALGAVLSWQSLEPFLSSPLLRRAAIAALGRSADPRAVRTLVQALDNAQGVDFTDALCALGEFVKDPDGLESVGHYAASVSSATAARLIELALLDETTDELRRAAMLVASAIGAPNAADCAVRLLAFDRFLADAHMALAALGDAAVPALVVAAQDADEVVRASALRLLAGLAGPRVPPSVIEAARSALFASSSDVISEALSLLARFGDAGCLGDLSECLERVPRGTLKAAEAALSSLGLRFPEEARRLALRAAPDARSAHAACVLTRALGPALRGSAEADLGFLSAALSNASGAVRCAAVEALTDLGGARAAEAVAFASTDEEPEVCRAAVAALGRMRSEQGTAVGLPRLVELVERSTDPELLEFAIRALAETHAPEAAEVLRPLLRSSQPLLAVCAVEALAELSVEGASEALLDGLQHAEPEVVKAAMQALSERPTPQAIARIGSCLEHEAWDVRRLAADLLGRVSGDIALGLLRARLAREDSPTVQAAIGRALERIAGIRRTPPPGSFRPR